MCQRIPEEKLCPKSRQNIETQEQDKKKYIDEIYGQSVDTHLL